MPASCSGATISLNSASDSRRRGVARLGREEADRVVAPVVRQPLLEQMAVVDEGVDRQQLDRGDAERLQM